MRKKNYYLKKIIGQLRALQYLRIRSLRRDRNREAAIQEPAHYILSSRCQSFKVKSTLKLNEGLFKIQLTNQFLGILVFVFCQHNPSDLHTQTGMA